MASKSSSSEASRQRNCIAIGDVEGVIHESIIAGRDVNLIIRIVQQTGGQFPQPCNLPVQLAALQQALPHLNYPAEKAVTQATIERLERAKTAARKTVEVGGQNGQPDRRKTRAAGGKVRRGRVVDRRYYRHAAGHRCLSGLRS